MHGCKDEFDFPLSYIHEIYDVTCLQFKPKIALNVLERKSRLTYARRVKYGDPPSYDWCQEISVSSHGFRERDICSTVVLGQLQC